MKDDIPEAIRVSIIGLTGFVATIQLADVATIVSIMVGIATLCYVVAKTYFLIKHNGADPRE